MSQAIIIPDKEWSKLEDYTRLCPDEIACMGYAKLEDGNVVVDEVFLVPQIVSLGSVEFVEKGFPFAIDKAVKEGRLDELKFCWHSHATHEAFFSTTDEDMIRKVKAAGPIDWFASAILNKKGNVWGQVDFFDIDGPMAEFTDHQTVELDILVSGRLNVDKTREEEMDELVEKKKYTSPKALSSSTSKRGGGTTTDGTEFVVVATAADWKLHREAKEAGWEAYIDDQDCAYYWNAGTSEFMGSAVIPKKSDGSYAVDIQVDIFGDDPSSEDLETIENTMVL